MAFPLPLAAAWWLAFLIQLVALPGVVLPVLPGLILLPLGAGLWCWAVGWAAGWPCLVAALVILVLGWGPMPSGCGWGPPS